MNQSNEGIGIHGLLYNNEVGDFLILDMPKRCVSGHHDDGDVGTKGFSEPCNHHYPVLSWQPVIGKNDVWAEPAIAQADSIVAIGRTDRIDPRDGEKHGHGVCYRGIVINEQYGQLSFNARRYDRWLCDHDRFPSQWNVYGKGRSFAYGRLDMNRMIEKVR